MMGDDGWWWVMMGDDGWWWWVMMGDDGWWWWVMVGLWSLTHIVSYIGKLQYTLFVFYNHNTFCPSLLLPLTSMLGVSKNNGTPQIIHSNRLNRVFHHKPSILGYPYFWKHPCFCFSILINSCFVFISRRVTLCRRAAFWKRSLLGFETVDFVVNVQVFSQNTLPLQGGTPTVVINGVMGPLEVGWNNLSYLLKKDHL